MIINMGKPKKLGEKYLLQCNFVHHESPIK
jgi:hypothetical protein